MDYPLLWLVWIIASVLAFYSSKNITKNIKHKALRFCAILMCVIFSVPYLIVLFSIVTSKTKENERW